MQIKRMKRQLSAACHYSYTRLALNYYMYYETSLEESLLDNRLEPLNTAFHGLLRGFLDGTCAEDALWGLRSQVMAEMETATAYTDAFQAYEYVLNRLEGRFAPQPVGTMGGEDHDEAMTGRIMAYITDARDAMTVNERIRSVLGQLPVRLTRNRFFSLVEEGLSVYRGSTRESLNDMFYILRSEALLYVPADMVTGYGELHSILEEFRTADYKSMTQSSYRHLTDEMKRAGRMLMEDTARLMLLMELVNDLYVLFLSRASAMMEVSEEQCLKRILSGILFLFEAGADAPIPDGITGLLNRLEGRQEAYFEQWMEDGLSSGELKDIKSQEGEASKLYKVEMLLSGSSFMSLEPAGPGDGEIVDQAGLTEAANRFFEEFSAAFEGQPRLLVRAVMAKVLSSLPVFFQSLDEVQEYIRNSLASCTDYMEKAITMKLITDMMEQDGMEEDDIF